MNKINDTVYINLKERVDRNEHMQNMLSFLGLSYQRFEAIKCDNEEGVEMSPNYKELRLGALGLWKTHIKILESRQGQKGTLLVLEDDVLVTKNALKKVNKILEDSLDHLDWDVARAVFPGAWKTLSSKNTKALKRVDDFVYKFETSTAYSKFHKKEDPSIFSGGGHFVLINKKSIQKILNYIHSEYFYPIDSIYSTNQINSYALKFANREIKQFYGKFGTNIGENLRGHYTKERASKINIEYE